MRFARGDAEFQFCFSALATAPMPFHLHHFLFMRLSELRVLGGLPLNCSSCCFIKQGTVWPVLLLPRLYVCAFVSTPALVTRAVFANVSVCWKDIQQCDHNSVKHNHQNKSRWVCSDRCASKVNTAFPYSSVFCTYRKI